MPNVMFRIGLSGIHAHRNRLQTASHNLSNANTPGYSRQSVSLQSRLFGGVSGSAPLRASDAALARNLRELTARHGFANGSTRLLQDAERVLGAPGDHPINRAIDTFFSRVGDVTLDAASTVRREALLDSAEELASTIRATYADIERVRNAADTRVVEGVNEVNRLSERIAQLNHQIGSSVNPSPDLLDQRDQTIEVLSELVEVRVLASNSNQVNVQTREGDLLVGDDTAFAIEATPDPQNPGHPRITIGGQPANLGGELGGIIEARDGAVVDQLAALDDLAFDLAASINTALQSGVDMDGNAGQALYDVGATRAGAARVIRLNANLVESPRLLALSQSGAAADNQIALELLGLQDSGIIGASGARVGDAIANSLFDLASATRSAASEADAAMVQRDETFIVRESLLGVSTDEELINITEAQRAYQSAARVLRTADEITQEILSLKR